MSTRELEVDGHKLTIHEFPDTHDSATGRALTGAWLWDSSLHLANYLATSPEARLAIRGATVLELGAGATGLPGLFAAAVLGAARVVLSDVAALVPALQANVVGNGVQGVVEARELRWGSEEVGKMDVLVMSDVLYDVEEMEGLARTMRAAWGEGTRAWVATEVRDVVAECLEALRRKGFETTATAMAMARRMVKGEEEQSADFVVFCMTMAGDDRDDEDESD